MIRFECDYHEGCAPEILKRLSETNMEQTSGYGLDDYSREAKRLIIEACGLQPKGTQAVWREEETSGIVHLMVGGTQTNTVVINALLRPHQGVICADSGHINVHESGAIEHIGHKVMALPTKDGKLTAAQVMDAIMGHMYDPNIEHVVQPGMVYLSYPTETGLLYTKQELTGISAICRQYAIPLYIDGARMGYGLMADNADVTLKDIASLSDLFYIGGTKQGALFGEALVIVNEQYRKDFRYMIKQGGGMLAKGRLLGLQFMTLFTNDLYWRLARHADDMAMKIRRALEEKGYTLVGESHTNQQFVLIPQDKWNELGEEFDLSMVENQGEHVLARICTDWATLEENVDKLIASL